MIQIKTKIQLTPHIIILKKKKSFFKNLHQVVTQISIFCCSIMLRLLKIPLAEETS